MYSSNVDNCFYLSKIEHSESCWRIEFLDLINFSQVQFFQTITVTLPSLFAMGLRCCERLSAMNGVLVIQGCRHTATSLHFKRLTLVLWKNNSGTMPTPECYTIHYRQHKTEKEKSRKERKIENTKNTDANKNWSWQTRNSTGMLIKKRVQQNTKKKLRQK